MIRGVTLRDGIRNAVIGAELHATPLWEEKERIRSRWYRHVMRMEEDKKPKRYLMWKSEGKRPVGRSQKRWIEGAEKRKNTTAGC